MAFNPDPHPGRWMLPLVVLGMVAFTYVFVSALPGAEAGRDTVPVDGTPGTSATSIPNREEPGPDTTTPDTTQPAPGQNQAYIEAMDALAVELSGYQTEMAAINGEFDGDEINFATAVERMTTLVENVTAWRDKVTAVTAPDGLGEAHATLVAAAESAAAEAANALEGLRRPAPDTGEFRRESAAKFDAAVELFSDTLTGIGGAGIGDS